MSITHCRDGKLSPYHSQELRWLVPDMWAISQRSNGFWELFKAVCDNRFVIGKTFVFKFTYPTLADFNKYLPELLIDTGRTEGFNKCLINRLSSPIVWEELGDTIDRTHLYGCGLATTNEDE